MINLKDLIRKFPSFQQRDVSTVIDWTVEDTDELVKWINNKIKISHQKANSIREKLNRISNKIQIARRKLSE